MNFLTRTTSRFLFLSKCHKAVSVKPQIILTNSLKTSHIKLISTSQPKHFWPYLIFITKPLARVSAALVGRKLRKWWRNLPENEKNKYKQNYKGKLWAILASLFCIVSTGFWSHVIECPLTGRRKFLPLTEKQMEKLGQEYFEMFLDDKNILDVKHPLYDRVEKVVNRILNSNQDISNIGTKNWTISVVEDDVQNAFVLPNGNIFIFTGMLEICDNDDQLAMILAHEMAHALLNHNSEELCKSNLMTLGLIIPLAVLWAIVPNDGIALVADWFFNKVKKLTWELPFSRAIETEADVVGLKLASKACFDVREGPLFWDKMKYLEEQMGDVIELPEYLSTHPSHANRSENLTKLLPGALDLRRSIGCDLLSSPCQNNARMEHFIATTKKLVQGLVGINNNVPTKMRIVASKD